MSLFGDPIPEPQATTEAVCPMCGCLKARVKLRPDTPHHAELRCPSCKHHRWLPKPKPKPEPGSDKELNMAKISEEFTSGYMTFEDLEGQDLVLTITTAEIVKFKEKDGYEKKKILLKFKERKEAMILNLTNRETLVDLYGDDTEDWEGKRITVYPTKVLFEGKKVGCVRIKDEVPKSGRAAEDKKPARKPAPAPVVGDDGEDDDVPPF